MNRAPEPVRVNSAANFGRELFEVCTLVAARITPGARPSGELA
jgi:hypothetical protein